MRAEVEARREPRAARPPRRGGSPPTPGGPASVPWIGRPLSSVCRSSPRRSTSTSPSAVPVRATSRFAHGYRSGIAGRVPGPVRGEPARQRDQLVAAMGERRDEHPERRQDHRLAVARAQHGRGRARARCAPTRRRSVEPDVLTASGSIDVGAADRSGRVASRPRSCARAQRRPDALPQVHEVHAAPDVAGRARRRASTSNVRELPRRTTRAAASRTARGTGPRTTPPSPPRTRAGRRATSSAVGELQRVDPFEHQHVGRGRSGGARRHHVVGDVGVDRHRDLGLAAAARRRGTPRPPAAS